MRSEHVSDERSRRECAHAYIQQKIISGDLPAGSAISELALAKEIGISRTPVREAIGQLVAEGLVELIPNRGAVVAQFGRNDILELFELREALEVYAVRKVAESGLREADATHLRGILNEPLLLKNEVQQAGASCLDGDQMRRFMTADLGFHTLLLHAAGNRRILKVVNDTRLLIRIFEFPHAGHTPAQLERIHEQHAAILDAILQHNTEGAACCIAQHIAGSRQERINAFDAHERDSSLRWSISNPMSSFSSPTPASRRD
jgi:DNA-binding GntR family transcriptional regulator